MQDDSSERAYNETSNSNPSSFISPSDSVRILVDELIEQFQLSNCETSHRNPRSIRLQSDLPKHHLIQYETWLAEAHSYLHETSSGELTSNNAAEWVLDNYYIIRQALRQIKEDLPPKYYAQLPRLSGGPFKGLPRIYAIACGILSHQQNLLNSIDLETILIQLQNNVSLKIGELWALPIFLRYNSIETLAHKLKTLVPSAYATPLPQPPPPFSLPTVATRPNLSPTEDRTVANVILSLRVISEQNWNDFFEAVSLLERRLREDPAGVYPLMDFKTRDLYRKEIELLSFASAREETELAEITLQMARENRASGPQAQTAQPAGAIPLTPVADFENIDAHIGQYLLGKKRRELEERLNFRPPFRTRFQRWGYQHANTFYLASILILATLLFIIPTYAANLPALLAGSNPFQWALLAIIGLSLLVPALTGAASITNWVVTLRVPPRILPKLHFKDEIPDGFETLVVIPALIASHEEIDSLVHQLEMHYLRNPEPGLLFALLTDFQDADSETLPEDDDLLAHAEAMVEGLNVKYKRLSLNVAGPENHTTFYLFHRKRLWNPAEGKWMGWERKRGKLHEMNLLLRGGKNLSFSNGFIDPRESIKLHSVRFVITLDADTILPRGGARRLVGTLAHPLNRAKFHETSGLVVSGYTILQPRMEIHPRSTNYSWFTRIFAGDTGLDLYTLAVSDAYQDLFGEGSFVGKGIYDVDAFERSVDQHIPENSILSHDLLEGLMGRAGLVTDITMIEDYPQNYLVQVMRQRRWTRGDWQLLPWLVNPKKFRKTFSAIDRWKIFDNLLRSILVSALVLIFTVGLLAFPALAPIWSGIVLVSLGIPLLTSMGRSVLQTLNGENYKVAFRSSGANLMRWLIALAFLPYEAYVNLDAIFTTLYRLTISHRYLLQWTTAAQSAKLLGVDVHKNSAWQKMTASLLFSVTLSAGVQAIHWTTNTGGAPALLFAAPILILWVSSPWIVGWMSRPILVKRTPLTEEQEVSLRQLIRRTWGFFERFVGPEDHWLPPDHYQESPAGIIAHHTSPSNIGLLFTSTLAAYDFGYLDQLGLATRLSTTMDTLGLLDRYRGHFMNWYDTLSLQPLHPRYISTVDSGNLAASLIVTAQACNTVSDDPIFRWGLWQGYLDTLSNLTETLTGMRKAEFDQPVEEINQLITAVRARILAIRDKPDQWYALFQDISGSFWQDLSNRLMQLVKVGNSAFDLEALRKLQEVAGQVERLHLAVQRTIVELVPWIPLLEQSPRLFAEARYTQAFELLRATLPYNPVLNQIRAHAKEGLAGLLPLREVLAAASIESRLPVTPEYQAEQWLNALEQALIQASVNVAPLLIGFTQIAALADQYVNEMDFKFLYHPQRRVFHIGFNLETGLIDNNFYDLLASEARIASLIAIAKGDVPQSHWLQLGRPLTQVGEFTVLLSWSGTMFEYLMPPLFLRSYAGTLLDDSARGAVSHQISFGKEKEIPWGISESGFYRFDANQNYQYRAFGVPGLGFKRGLEDDLVIAPYASLMAIGYHPHAVVRNLDALKDRNSLGLYGVYEAIDFTPDRLLLDETSSVVREYMAHHQGMIMMAMANFLHNDIMVRRMHSDPRIQSVELLLQEQVPQTVPLQDPYAEDIKRTPRTATGLVEIDPWNVPVHTSIPQMHILSNGSYNVLISNMGGGYSSWRDVDLTRWQPDGVLDPWGTWIYIQEIRKGTQEKDRIWSTTHQPTSDDATRTEATYSAHMAVFRRTERGVTSTMEVTVAPNDPLEIRRIRLQNFSNYAAALRLTSYGEVILSPQTADARHPAFNKLFIESEFVPELNLQIFIRRPRSKQETTTLVGHMLMVEGSNETARHEADRNKFIGRNHTLRAPAALTSEEYLTGSSGATLDPIFSLGQVIELEAHESASLAYLTFAAESRVALIDMARRYRNWTLIERTFHQADTAAQIWLGKQEIDTPVLKGILQVLSALIYSSKETRAAPEIIAANRLGQSGLWRFGISADYPILLLEIENADQVDLVREALQIHTFLRTRQFKTDLVILNLEQSNYGADLDGVLFRMVSKMNCEEWVNQRGGIFILHGDQIHPEERTLLATAARVMFTGGNGALLNQLPGYSIQVHHLPEHTPTRMKGETANTFGGILDATGSDLKFFNGTGGFSANGREYVIELPPGKTTPAPWVNVIGYPGFGFLVSEAGSQCTWAVNSGENRLTPWFNDPVCDPTGEALYLRDEETGDVWTPTPLPSNSGQPYRVTHGAGYTIFDHSSYGLRQSLTLFASPEDPVKIIHLKIENTLAHPRRITATQYIEWVLGATHGASINYIIPEYDPALECLLAANPYSADFGGRVAFLIASKTIHGLTADRTEFLGRGGTPALPKALRRLGLETRITPGEDPCAVLQIHLDLLPGASEEIYFVLGQGNDKEHTLALVNKYHDPANVSAAFERTHTFWGRLLDAIQIQTPEPATDMILNRWMLYQTLSSRIWGRTGFYQSSGAYGFRDQLQDVLALLSIDPAITRGQILNAAQHQFEEGDVLHWWHPPTGRGVRTRFSDDLLWLPYVTARYIEATGDTSVLDVKIPFLHAPLLTEGIAEHYGIFPQTEQAFSLKEHCQRAIEMGSTIGPHGLPLIGTGDWNDGFNRVGEKGHGESVWLAWFLCDVLQRFASLCERIGEQGKAWRYRLRAKDYANAVERSAWDGQWYLRAYYDNGEALGASQNEECQIDAIAQSWSVLSGAGDPQRSRLSMQSVLDRLVRPQERLSLLFAPPFDQTPNDPGYIKGYLPGIRENGGQYTHAAVWTAWAFAALGDGAQAGRLFDLLNPIYQSDSAEKISVYRVEPYVICADIYSQPPYLRRGGWTWYTGSAAWMYRLGLEAILGFNKIGNTLQITPTIPPEWSGFQIHYRFGEAVYHIHVHNPDHGSSRVQEIILDGIVVENGPIPLIDDTREHQLDVILGVAPSQLDAPRQAP